MPKSVAKGHLFGERVTSCNIGWKSRSAKTETLRLLLKFVQSRISNLSEMSSGFWKE